MEDSCPPTPLHVLSGRDSKSPLQVALSSPESDRMKSPSDRLSPDSRCVICLGRLMNKSFTDSCLHQFCFQCLLQWSKVKPECPLCKQPFKSIIHNVRSNEEYDQYHIERGESAYSFLHTLNIDLYRLPSQITRHRYRTTMGPQQYFREIASVANLLSRSRQFEDPYQIPPLIPLDSQPSHSLRRPSRHQHYNGHRGSMRHRSTTEFRRSVYAQDLWVQDLADVSGRYRECTPQFYRDNPSQIQRVVPWLNREVNVLLDNCNNHSVYVMERILATMTQHSIRSREFRAVVQPYFGAQTDHFIHEFYTFARSVYDMAGFDENAVYSNNPNYATEVQEISSSNDDDSDIEVIETVRTGETRKSSGPKEGFKKILLKRAGGSWNIDEPLPGPSGLNNQGSQEPIEVCESDPDEVEVLDYVKPEPEIVTLSSEEEENHEHVHFSDLDLSNGDFAEIPCTISDDEETISNPTESSDDNYEPYKKTQKYKSPKGKCKSGVGLKGKQKKKYIKSRKARKDKSPSRSISSSRDEDRSRRRRRRISTSSSSSSSSSTSSSRSSSRRSRSSSSVSSSSSYRRRRRDSSSSDNEPISKYISKRKENKNHKKNKKSKSEKKSSEKRKRKVHKDSKKDKDKRKVKSCVVVPKVLNPKSSVRPSRARLLSSDDSSRPLDSYWSDIRNSRKSSKIILKRKRSTSSSRENTSRAKYSSRVLNTDESSRDSFIDVINMSKNQNSSDVYSNYSDNLFGNSYSSNRSDMDLPHSSASTSHIASSSSDIKINVSSDYESD